MIVTSTGSDIQKSFAPFENVGGPNDRLGATIMHFIVVHRCHMQAKIACEKYQTLLTSILDLSYFSHIFFGDSIGDPEINVYIRTSLRETYLSSLLYRDSYLTIRTMHV